MTLSPFFSGMLTGALVVLSVLAHELAHGYVALLEGDETALRAGRLTWNPLAHVDPVLTIAMPIMALVCSHGTIVLGGAKPVPVNPACYRDGVRSELLVSLAGIAANTLIALMCSALMRCSPIFARLMLVNAGLVAFNLLPIPPLDGWRVWRAIRAVRPVPVSASSDS